MYYLAVAVPVILDRTFTYSAPSKVSAGVRVKVQFGRQKLIGVVMDVTDVAPAVNFEIRPISEALDEAPIYSDALLSLARWLSSYYLHPIGEVVRAMLPVSLVKKGKKQFRLTEDGLSAKSNDEHKYYELLRFLFPNRVPVRSQTNLSGKLAQWFAERGEKVTFARIEKLGLVVREAIDTSESRSPHWTADAVAEAEKLAASEPPVLTDGQQLVTERIISSLGEPEPKPFLLHGVTGAGKTEVYLKLISEILGRDPSKQVMVLVPEIALTPQMTRVFSARFPGQVAVVHSAMQPEERWRELQSIRHGDRQILIGPRSAVFAAFSALSMLIVDEEHDSSYKQSTGLTYNGRDVAVMRGHLEKIPVVLGSATPAMESYANAMQGKYQLLELLERANRKPLPEISFITTDSSKGFARRLAGRTSATPVIDLPVDEKVLQALRENLAEGKQAMVLVNRRGFAYYLFSLRERKAVTCPNCSISLTVHEKSTILRCHYCDFQKSVERMIPPDAKDSYVLVGYGSEQMELFLREGLPGARIQRVDSDSVGQRDALPQILDGFRQGKIDILVGTQMLAKGHDFAKVTLICILEIDQTLNLPDFRAGERTFQLMVQAAGRAGRGELSGRVLVQTQREDHPVLQAALNHSYAQFWADQLQFRAAHAYPPLARMIVFEFSSSKREKLLKWMGELELFVTQRMREERSKFAQLSILGPSVPPLETIRGRSRRTLLLMSKDRAQLWGFARLVLGEMQNPPGDLRMRVDVDPQSLL